MPTNRYRANAPFRLSSQVPSFPFRSMIKLMLSCGSPPVYLYQGPSVYASLAGFGTANWCRWIPKMNVHGSTPQTPIFTHFRDFMGFGVGTHPKNTGCTPIGPILAKNLAESG
jgi:hypothetical protein